MAIVAIAAIMANLAIMAKELFSLVLALCFAATTNNDP
jgi:hypothetical protein